VDQSETVEVRMKCSPYGSPIPLFLRDRPKLHPGILMGSLDRDVKQGRRGKTSQFLILNIIISKPVGVTAIVTIITNKMSHMGFRLTPRSMTLDDLAISSNSIRISRDFVDLRANIVSDGIVAQ